MDSTALVLILVGIVAFYLYRKEQANIEEKIAFLKKNHFRDRRYIEWLERSLSNLSPDELARVKQASELEWEEAHRRDDGVYDYTSSRVPSLPKLR